MGRVSNVMFGVGRGCGCGGACCRLLFMTRSYSHPHHTLPQLPSADWIRKQPCAFCPPTSLPLSFLPTHQHKTTNTHPQNPQGSASWTFCCGTRPTTRRSCWASLMSSSQTTSPRRMPSRWGSVVYTCCATRSCCVFLVSAPGCVLGAPDTADACNDPPITTLPRTNINTHTHTRTQTVGPAGVRPHRAVHGGGGPKQGHRPTTRDAGLGGCTGVCAYV